MGTDKADGGGLEKSGQSLHLKLVSLCSSYAWRGQERDVQSVLMHISAPAVRSRVSNGRPADVSWFYTPHLTAESRFRFKLQVPERESAAAWVIARMVSAVFPHLGAWPATLLSTPRYMLPFSVGGNECIVVSQ